MEWVERLNSAINYIEENLFDEIDYEKVGRIAGCSSYHFQRMFTYMAGLPLSEYIRRRKMSLALVELQNSNSKIIDLAFKYGYNSPTAFNRAFQSIHGMPPSNVKKAVQSGTLFKTFPPITFKMTIKGVEELNYRIEKKEAFRIVGISMPLDKEVENNFKVVPLMWQKALEDGKIAKLSSMIDNQPFGLLGVSVCNDLEQWKYFIAVSSSKGKEEFDEYIVPSQTWAIFPGKGPVKSIQELETRIITEWIQTSGYEYANAPDIEVYLNSDPENAEYEVWIPVMKKN